MGVYRLPSYLRLTTFQGNFSNKSLVCGRACDARKELSPEVPMTKLEPLSSPAPPKSFPVVVKEKLGAGKFYCDLNGQK
jgi:hypothetical protein